LSNCVSLFFQKTAEAWSKKNLEWREIASSFRQATLSTAGRCKILARLMVFGHSSYKFLFLFRFYGCFFFLFSFGLGCCFGFLNLWCQGRLLFYIWYNCSYVLVCYAVPMELMSDKSDWSVSDCVLEEVVLPTRYKRMSSRSRKKGRKIQMKTNIKHELLWAMWTRRPQSNNLYFLPDRILINTFLEYFVFSNLIIFKL